MVRDHCCWQYAWFRRGIEGGEISPVCSIIEIIVAIFFHFFFHYYYYYYLPSKLNSASALTDKSLSKNLVTN